jgi:uncharacterized FAD-dependent dehydrogenase
VTTTLVDLFVPLDELQAPLGVAAERALGWPRGRALAVRVIRRALDARKGRPIGYRLRCEVSDHVGSPGDSSAGPAPQERAAGAAPSPHPELRWSGVGPPPRVVVVGTGPAGTWVALRLAAAGVPVTMLDRGKPVQPRRADLAQLTRGRLDVDSNYCFGEGGAGTFSDGKLYTRSKDRPGIAAVLADLVRFGAPAEVEIDARAHVGSNRLPRVLTAIRAHLESAGVVYRFQSECVGLRSERGRVRAVRLAGGDEVPADRVVLATGHSARSAYDWMLTAGLAMERKAIAVGVRLEHPQPCIDRIQYGAAAGDPRLPPAFYELSAPGGAAGGAVVEDGPAHRGAYSFCMCPGGWIVPAATEPDGVVVNGMSLSKRDSPFANAGFVVPVTEADFGPEAAGPLAGVAFQRGIERAAFAAGGGAFRAPAQRLVDFLAARPSRSVEGSSYRPGLVPGDIRAFLPEAVVLSLRQALAQLVRRVPGFLHPAAQLIGCETRTSAPVRILRDPISLQSPSLVGVYPCGEGAGYAGGIVSAALDGVRVASRICADGG